MDNIMSLLSFFESNTSISLAVVTSVLFNMLLEALDAIQYMSLECKWEVTPHLVLIQRRSPKNGSNQFQILKYAKIEKIV